MICPFAIFGNLTSYLSKTDMPGGKHLFITGLLLSALVFSHCEKEEPEVTKVTDIDGFVYNTVKIGNQVWMKENLKTTRYRDGSIIPLTSSVSEWSAKTSGAYSSYDNDNANVTFFGALYNWYAITDNRGLCPDGWHIPTNEEWTELTEYLGGLEVAGGKMKSTNSEEWFAPNTGADNVSGFSAVGAGFRDGTGIYSGLKEISYFWSSSEYSPTHGIARKLFNNYSSVSFAGNLKQSGFSVRCLKD